ncbi:Kinetochore protein Nuf2 [Cinara cedri]|uniref:Kinetochore protein Nuf2 n=1 Tax=Cinara cedri TaxID=506608 RepID=A0A5E4NBD7_9HEMI|nr:Kinetochore protein Nuf2 [Cinara cedri]
MAWQPNLTSTAKQKSVLYVEYSNLIKELGHYMPQFKASVKDLQEPSQTFVTNFYTEVLNEFFCDVNNLTEIQVTQNLKYCDMYSETVPVLNMCTALRYIYSKLGIDDFGLNDICDPSSKRTYGLLQTMLNFIKYSDVKIHDVDEKMKAIRNMKDTIDKTKQQKEIIKNSINKMLCERKQRGIEIKTLTEELKIGKSELMNIQKRKIEMENELNKVKQEQDTIESKCFKLCELKNNIIRDINALRAQIVEAPDILKADHERLKRLKNEVTERKTLTMAQISAKKQTVLIMEQELEAQEKRLRLLTDVTEMNKIISKLTHDNEKTMQNKAEIVESSEILKEKIEFLEHECADIKNKIDCTVKDIEQEVNSLKSKYDALSKEKDETIKQKSYRCEIIQSIEDEINNCYSRKTEIELDVANIMQNFRVVRDKLTQMQNEYATRALKNNKII